MSISGIKTEFAPIESVIKGKTQNVNPAEEKKDTPKFSEMFTNAIKEVDALQKEADQKIEGMMLGKGVPAHEAMISLEKADLAFQLMNQVRTKVVRAYQQIIQTQI